MRHKRILFTENGESYKAELHTDNATGEPYWEVYKHDGFDEEFDSFGEYICDLELPENATVSDIENEFKKHNTK